MTIGALIVNLMVAISSSPIFTLLPKAANSSTSERTDLLGRLKRVFLDMKIASLSGDREFIGQEWIAYLEAGKISFTLRLRENQYVSREGLRHMDAGTPRTRADARR